MNKISIPTVHFAALNESTGFHEMISEMGLEKKTNNVTSQNEILDDGVSDQEMVEIIMGYMIANSTIEIMKKHQDFMKEILDEE